MDNFEEVYNKLKKEDISCFVKKEWCGLQKRLEREILPSPKKDFLNGDVIRETMFVSNKGFQAIKQMMGLKRIFSKKFLKKILKGDEFGKPLIKNNKYQTSHNLIHNLSHLGVFKQSGGTLNGQKTIVEWGGGYGCMAKIIMRINSEITYIIIDLPLVSCIQNNYLVELFGKDHVNLILSTKNKIKENKINILPLGLIKSFKLKTDMFISTWALSESSKYSQDYVRKNNFFGAKNILMAYSKGSETFPRPIEIEKDLINRGAILKKVKNLKKNAESYYLMCVDNSRRVE